MVDYTVARLPEDIALKLRKINVAIQVMKQTQEDIIKDASKRSNRKLPDNFQFSTLWDCLGSPAGICIFNLYDKEKYSCIYCGKANWIADRRIAKEVSNA